jgi:hypothetical protein
MKTFFKVNAKFLWGAIAITLLVHLLKYIYFFEERYSNNSVLIGLAIGAAVATLICTLILYVILSLLARISKANRDGNNNSLRYLVCWLFCLIFPTYGEVLSIPEKEDPKKIAIEACIAKFKSTNGNKYDTIIVVKDYCECAVNKLIDDKNLDIIKLEEEIRSKNSITYNETILPCLEESLIQNESNKEVIGFKDTDSISLVGFMNDFKVKVKIGGLAYYYILDSGASDVFIDKKMLKDYESLSEKVKITNLTPREYQMANGQKIICDRVQIDKLVIGDFIIPNVVVAITPNEAQPLLGQDVLKRFKSWSILNDTKQLVVIK